MRFIPKRRSKRTSKTTIESNSVMLEALCAYRDQLIMSDQTPEVQRKLEILKVQISTVWNSIPW